MMQTRLPAFAIYLTACFFTANSLAQEEEDLASIEVAIESLIKATNDDNPEIRNRGFLALQRIETSSEEVIERIRLALTDKNADIRQLAMQVLQAQRWSNETKGNLLYNMLMQDELEIAREAAGSFESDYQPGEIAKILNLLVTDEIAPERKEIFLSIIARNRTDVPKIMPVLEKLYEVNETEMRLQILGIIGNFGKAGQAGLPFLAEQINMQSVDVRLAAIDAIEQIMSTQQRRSSQSSNGRFSFYVDALFTKYDSNRNSRLDTAELKPMTLRQRFVDSNGDGSISRQEAINSLSGTATRYRRRDSK